MDDSSSERRPQRGGGEGEDSEVESVMLEANGAVSPASADSQQKSEKK